MHTAPFCKYDYLKLVLSALALCPRLVDAFGTRVWRRAGSSLFGSIISKGQAQSRRTLRPGGVVRRRCPSEMGPYLILRRYAAFRTQFAARARGQPQHKQPIDSPRAPYRQLSHICHRLNPCPLPTCNRSRPAQTMIKLSAIIAG